jgi:hypothetical protein
MRRSLVILFLAAVSCRTAGVPELPGHRFDGSEPRVAVEVGESRLAGNEASNPELSHNQYALMSDADGKLIWTTPTGETGVIDPASVAADTWGVYWVGQGKDQRALMAYYWSPNQISYLALSIHGANSSSVTLAPQSLSPDRIVYHGVDPGPEWKPWNPLATEAVVVRALGQPLGSPPLMPGERLDIVTVDAAKQFVWSTEDRFERISAEDSKQLIKADEGFCYVSWIGGEFLGESERVQVEVRTDAASGEKYWYLIAKRGRGRVYTRATCIMIRS